MRCTGTSINFGVTIPRPAYERLERARGYCSRSKFILMALDSLAQTIEKQSVQPDMVGPLQADGSVPQNPEGVYEHYE
jgi:hypothetical protein